MLSVVVPLYNESENIAPLYQAITAALDAFGRPYEIICVNDGSSDATATELTKLATQDRRLKVINFRRNYGQTAALMAGFDRAAGEIVVPIDGDLQNDPADIPALVKKLEEGYVVVSGWRVVRHDGVITRTLPSRIANRLISYVSGVKLHDYGCTLKAYRRDALKDVRLYGEMHRFIPIFASWHGSGVTEIPVTHRPRVRGSSKYGLNRIFKVLLDLIVIKFLEDYTTKPIYIFGFCSALCFLIALSAGSLAIYLRLFEKISFISTPLPLLVALGLMSGLMFILLGLLAEILIRIYFEAQARPVYYIRNTINLEGLD